VEGAICCYRDAITADPKYAPAHGALGLALLEQGRFAEARDSTRKALDLLPPNDSLRPLVSRQLQRCERLLALDEKLPAVLQGDAKPADAVERLDLAVLCGEYKQRYAAAARFSADAFAEQPKLADDLRTGYRYNAARAAALAAAGQGKDAARLADKEQVVLRMMALAWLRADLAAWARQLEVGSPQARGALQQALQHWQRNPDFAAVRDDAALANLPATERGAWQKLWAEVQALLQRAEEKK
jgi:tetratricopeptide (TPR) repeat protein